MSDEIRNSLKVVATYLPTQEFLTHSTKVNNPRFAETIANLVDVDITRVPEISFDPKIVLAKSFASLFELQEFLPVRQEILTKLSIDANTFLEEDEPRNNFFDVEEHAYRRKLYDAELTMIGTITRYLADHS